MAPLQAFLESHHRRHPGPTGAGAMIVEHRVRPTPLGCQLGPNSFWREHRSAAEAGRPGSGHGTVGDLSVGLGLEYPELDPGWNAIIPYHVGA